MKIDRAILACDSNPNYTQFWPVVARAWADRIGVNPTLYYIGHNCRLDKCGGEIVEIDPIPNIRTSFQAQCIRLLVPALYQDDVSIISDMDMIPISRAYFQDSIKDVDSDKFVIYRSYHESPVDHESDHDLVRSEIPICYTAGLGKTWGEIFNTTDLSEIRRRLCIWYEDESWFSDQRMLYQCVTNWPEHERRCRFLSDAVTMFQRLDRSTALKNVDDLDSFTDFHLPRTHICKLSIMGHVLRRLRLPIPECCHRIVVDTEMESALRELFARLELI